MNIYIGIRDQDGKLIVAKEIDYRNDLVNHSPDGPDVGNLGSASAQTALAILADYVNDDEQAVALHQRVKENLISKLPQDKQWILDENDIQKAILGDV